MRREEGENMKKTSVKKKTAFISYCHGDVEQKWIQKLVKELGKNGIECIVDIYDLKLGQDLNYFMEQLKKTDKVLILCGKVYKEKADSREGGVGTETQIISNDVYYNVNQIKAIPIIIERDGNGKPYLPHYLESRKYIDFSDNKLFMERIDELVNFIHGFSSVTKPKVKTSPKILQNKFVKNLKKNRINNCNTYFACSCNGMCTIV